MLLEPVGPLPARAVLARTHPVAKLIVCTVISVALVLTVDAVTAGTALLLELLALPWAGLAGRQLRRVGLVMLIAFVGAVPAALLTVLFGEDSGRVLLSAGGLTVSSGALFAGLGIMARIVAIGLPGVVLLATTDPTDLADGLAQVLHLPNRFVLAALAGLRLFGVIVAEWQALGMARRARGLEGSGVAGARLRLGQLFALLVLTIRQAATLATAMEARGFGASTVRTWARPSRLRPLDVGVMAGGLLVAVLATTAGVLAGTWQLLLS